MVTARAYRARWIVPAGAAVAALALALPMGSAEASTASTYTQTNLVSNVPGLAQVTDPNLVNAWGMSVHGTSPLWVSDNGTDETTLYAGGVDGSPQGAPIPLVVAIPGGAPTGQVSNLTSDFVVHDGAGHSGPALFLFVGETGHLTGWNPGVGLTGTQPTSTTAEDAVVKAHGVYKGLAMGTLPTGAPVLYAANFASGQVEVYDGSFKRIMTSGMFVDPQLPKHYAPFNIMVWGNRVYVAYAKQGTPPDEVDGAGLGRVDVFSLQGGLVHRLQAHSQLNAPWGLTIAPAGFGSLAGDLLVGNFGDGRIHAYDPMTLAARGTLNGANGKPLWIDGLWALMPGNGTEGGTDQVLFTAGPDDEANGLLGVLSASG